MYSNSLIKIPESKKRKKMGKKSKKVKKVKKKNWCFCQKVYSSTVVCVFVCVDITFNKNFRGMQLYILKNIGRDCMRRPEVNSRCE